MTKLVTQPALLFALVSPLFLGSLSPAASSAPVHDQGQDEGGGEKEGDDPAADERPEVKTLIEEMQDHAKKRGKEDDAAISAIDRLTQEFARSGPKDREAIVKSLEWCFGQSRPDEITEGVPDTRLYEAAGTALGEMAPESVKPLAKLIDHKSIKKAVAARSVVIRSLGKTRHPDGVKPLLDLMDDKDDAIIAAAAQALGCHDKAPEATRKEIFEELLKTLMGTKAAMDADPENTIARERFYAIAASISTALSALSGQPEQQPEEWQRWWNKNKKESWAPKEG